MEVSSLNKFEKYELIIKLYKEGKTYREIARIAHVSIRDIKPAIKKYERSLKSKIKKAANNEAKPVNKISKSSRAYHLLLEGKTPVQIAIELNLGFEEARKYWTEFLKLQRMKKLYNLYVYNECHLDYVLKIYYFLLRNKIDFRNFENVLHVAYDVTKLYQTHANLKTEVEELKRQKNYWLNYDNLRLPTMRPLPPMRPMPWVRRGIY